MLLMLNAVDVHFHVDFVNVVAVLIISINKLNERIRLIWWISYWRCKRE